MAILNKESFAALRDDIFAIQSEYVELKDGYGVYVVQLTTDGAISLASFNAQNPDYAMLNWAAACCVDENYEQVFSVDDLRRLPQALTHKLIDAVVRVNGLLNKTAVEDAEKNSEEAAS